MRIPLLNFLLISAAAGLAGCSAVAEIAYDYALDHKESHCEETFFQTERQSCFDRVKRIRQQAELQRKSASDSGKR